MKDEITITTKEYKELVEAAVKVDVASVRIEAFADFVNSEKYSIDREDCGRYLGFEVIEEED